MSRIHWSQNYIKSLEIPIFSGQKAIFRVYQIVFFVNKFGAFTTNTKPTNKVKLVMQMALIENVGKI